MKINAYAKINLSLAITGLREDGYHTLHTVMQQVSLHDVLTVERAEALTFACSEPSLNGQNNLCVKAAKAFFSAARVCGGADIFLQKQIPTGAGLGGGSADAAAVLQALNTLYGNPFSRQDLLALGATLGADVPFCLHGGKCLCTGIGEILTPLERGEPLQLVIAKGQSGLSTPEMYRRMDAAKDTWSSSRRRGYFNDFQAVAESVLPDISLLRHRLLASGAEFAMMTGSGSAVFGIFPDMTLASSCAESLQREGFFSQVCVTL